MRAVEVLGEDATTTIDLPMAGRSIPASLGPHEIASYRVPIDRGLPIVEVDLLERPTAAPA